MQEKTTIRLLDFLKTGHLGPLHLGITIQETVAALGVPTEQFQLRQGFLLAYGGWEIQFKEEKPHQAYLIHHDELVYDCTNHDEVIQFKNDIFELDLGLIKAFKKVRVKDVVAWLEKEKVPFQLKKEDQQPLIKLESGAFIDFLDVEPLVPEVGVHACPGKNLELQQNDGKIEKIDDFVLYTIGIVGN